MAFSLVLLEKLISMMLMALVGYILVKTGILGQPDSRVISLLLVYVLQPCLVLRSLQIELTPDRLHGFIFGSIFASLTMVFSILFSELAKRRLNLDGVDRATLVYSNVGNLTMPLVSMALGPDMVFYCSAFQIPFHTFIWTHGISIIRGDRKLNLRKIFLNPSIIALITALILLITQTPIPPVIDSAVKGFQDMVAASSMMLVGMVIAGSDLRSVFANKKSYLISFLRLIVLPVLSMLLLFASGVITRYPYLRPVAMIIMLGAAAPSGSMVVQFAVVHKKDAVKASIYNVMTTILCVITLPFIIFLFQMLFPE